jgi:hypothetical protein
MGWVVNATPGPLYHRERPGTHCTGGWVGLRAGLETMAVLKWKWLWNIDGTLPTREKWSNGQNAFPLPLCPPHVPPCPTWRRVSNAAVREACDTLDNGTNLNICHRAMSYVLDPWTRVKLIIQILGERRPVQRADNLITCMCRLSWNLGASTYRNPQGLSRNCFTFYLYFYIFRIIC